MKHPKNITNVCDHCGKAFATAHREQRNCSRACHLAGRKRDMAAFFLDMANFEVTEGGCHLWIRGKDPKGYGRIHYHGRQRFAHRVAWEVVHGPIPDGLEVCHNCPDGDNPSCVNVQHLWLGTHLQNMADCVAKGRISRGDQHKARMRPVRGDAHCRAKLNAETVRQIREMRVATGWSYTKLAKHFGCSHWMTRDVITGRKWAHVGAHE